MFASHIEAESIMILRFLGRRLAFIVTADQCSETFFMYTLHPTSTTQIYLFFKVFGYYSYSRQQTRAKGVHCLTDEINWPHLTSVSTWQHFNSTLKKWENKLKVPKAPCDGTDLFRKDYATLWSKKMFLKLHEVT